MAPERVGQLLPGRSLGGVGISGEFVGRLLWPAVGIQVLLTAFLIHEARAAAEVIGRS